MGCEGILKATNPGKCQLLLAQAIHGNSAAFYNAKINGIIFPSLSRKIY
jgi:hypothetical protein